MFDLELRIIKGRPLGFRGLRLKPFVDRYGEDVVAFHFTWKKDWPAVRRVLAVVEEALEPFEARPHWGKLFVMSPQRVRSLYGRLPDFQRLLTDYDPTGKFRNAFVDDHLFGEA